MNIYVILLIVTVAVLLLVILLFAYSKYNTENKSGFNSKPFDNRHWSVSDDFMDW